MKGIRLTAGLLIGAILMTSVPVDMFANSVNTDEYVEGVSVSFSAGAHAAIGESVVLEDTDVNTFFAGVSAVEAPIVAEPVNEYANIAIAQVEEALNIRSEANAESEAVGKLYANGAATVLETLDGWYKIESGNVVGYVSADFVVVGDEEVCKAASDRIGTITTGALKLREEPSTESDIKDLLEEGQKVSVVDESIEGWVMIEYSTFEGYVSADYIEIETVYTYAESKEEEEARLAAEAEAQRQREEAARKEAQEKAKKEETKKEETKKEEKEYVPPTGGDGQAVVDYALQFVGNPYVYGGTSLTNGVDCSGFIMKVYEAFGVSLPRTSYSQRFVGYEVSASDLQPGDIICYSGHVALYIGNGKIVHAANKEDGIKITNKWNYTTVITIRRIF